MKRITFLALIIVAMFGVSSAKAQVGVHLGVNIGNPYPYYEPGRTVIVHERPAYYPVRRGYYHRPVVYRSYGRPVIVDRRYYGPRPMHGYYHPNYSRHGYSHGYGRR
jgi:hypothetical protein